MRRLLVLLLVACGLTGAATSYASSEASSPIRIVASSNAPVTVGQDIVIRGTVRNARRGTQVLLEKRIGGRWTFHGRRSVGATRTFRFAHATTEGGVVRYYRVVAPAYGAQPRAVSNPLKVVVHRRTASVAARAVYEPGWRESALRVKVTGTIVGGPPATPVQLQNLESGHWITRARATANNGRFMFDLTSLPNRATRMRVVKPQDQRSRAANSPVFGAAVTAPRVTVDQSKTVKVPANGLGQVRFWARGGSDLLLSRTAGDPAYLSAPDGSTVRELFSRDQRVVLPELDGFYVVDFRGSPRSTITLGLTRTRQVTAQLDGPPTTLESWHPRTHVVQFEANKGDVIATTPRTPDGSDCKVDIWTLDSSAGERPQGLSQTVWSIKSDGRHELVLVTRCSSASTIQLSFIRAQRVSGSLEEPAPVPAALPGQPTIVEFDAPANQQINLEPQRVVTSSYWAWRPAGGTFQHSDSIFYERFKTSSAGRHELLLLPRDDEIDTRPVALCAARFYLAEVGGHPTRIDDWKCQDRVIVVEFAAEAGEVIGVEKEATGLMSGCSLRPVGSSDSVSCMSMKPLPVTGRYYAVFQAGWESPVSGSVHIWRAARANAVVDGEAVQVSIDTPRQRALIDVDVTEPGNLTVAFDLSGLGVGAHFSAEVRDAEGNLVPITAYDPEQSTIQFATAAPGRYQVRFRTGVDRTGTFTARVTSG